MSIIEQALAKSIDYETRLAKQAALIEQQCKTIKLLRLRLAAAESQVAWARRALGREVQEQRRQDLRDSGHVDGEHMAELADMARDRLRDDLFDAAMISDEGRNK